MYTWEESLWKRKDRQKGDGRKREGNGNGSGVGDEGDPGSAKGDGRKMKRRERGVARYERFCTHSGLSAVRDLFRLRNTYRSTYVAPSTSSKCQRRTAFRVREFHHTYQTVKAIL